MMRGRLLIICATLLAAGPVHADETPSHAIAVAGKAELRLPPDFALVQVGVVTQGNIVAKALGDNSAKMTRVIEAATQAGVAKKDIQTSQFEIRPQYEKQAGRNYYNGDTFRKIIGYAIENDITVRVRDIAKVAKVIDACVNAGANTGGNVRFAVKDLPQRLDDARRAAIRNARHKAVVLTEAADVKLGPALSITDNEANTYYNSPAFTPVEQVVVTGSRIPTPIEPGLVTVRSTVTVVFRTR